jgi:hypothetical protein
VEVTSAREGFPVEAGVECADLIEYALPERRVGPGSSEWRRISPVVPRPRRGSPRFDQLVPGTVG